MKTNTTLKYIIKIAAIAAISSIIMLFEFPLWFAPGFYKLDLSESVILMGSFALGPMAGVLMELLKNLLNLIINGTTTAYVGEFANFVTGCAFVLPAAFIYKYKKNFTSALAGMIASTLSLAVIGGLLNYFVMIPAFSNLYHMPIEAIINMGNAVNPLVGDLKSLIVFAVAPFNVVKGVLCSVLALLIYKRISNVLHK